MKWRACFTIGTGAVAASAMVLFLLVSIWNYNNPNSPIGISEGQPQGAELVVIVTSTPSATATAPPTPTETATSTPTAPVKASPTRAGEGEMQQIKPVQFLESDCSCVGLQPDPQAPMPIISAGRLTCNFAWGVHVVGGTPGDWNQVQTEIGPWKTLAEARQQLAADGKQLMSSGLTGTSDQDSLFYFEKQGTASFYYGEARIVYEEGYYLSMHLRGYYDSGEGQVRSILGKADQCMRAAIER